MCVRRHGHGIAIAPTDDRRHALHVLDELAHNLEPGLCHGDASLMNILVSGQDGWKYIDPRGMAGETAYDVAVLGMRIARLLPAQDATSRLAGLADVDPDRVGAWMLVADAARV